MFLLQASPVALYDAAYDRWRGLAVPAYATYDGRFTIVRGAKTTVRRYAVAYRESDGMCRVTGVPVDTSDRPDPSKVTDRCLNPGFAFSFVPQAGGATDATGLALDVPTPDPEASDALKTLANVRARSRPYDVTSAGDETIDGIATTHLVLRPYDRPDRHVLRDLWIDRATDGVVRLRGEATSGPNLFHVDFVATYAEDANAQTLVRVDAFGKAQLLFVRESGNVTFELTNVAYPASLPPETFGSGRTAPGS